MWSINEDGFLCMGWSGRPWKSEGKHGRENVAYTGPRHTKNDKRIEKENLNTFPSHANFEAFFEAAVLTLIAVVLVDGTVPVGPARVCEVAPHTALEEALAALACELAVMLAA